MLTVQGGAHGTRPATHIGSVAGVHECVDAGMRCIDLVAKFNTESELSGVIVLTEQLSVVGLISRHRLLSVFALPYRTEVYFKRPIGDVIDELFPATTYIASDVAIPDAAELVLKRGRETLHEPLLVVFPDASPPKIVEVHALLMALLALQDVQFNDLRRTRDSLVQAEKLASLGGLVAGVAHEINTPVGVSLSAASYLAERLKEFAALVDSKQLRKSDVDAMVKQAGEASDLILHNMARASTLIQSFKRVSADQTSEVRREFDLAQTLEEVVRSVSPSFKHQAVKVSVNSQPGLQMDSYPGAIAQIVTNLMQNAVMHAFPEGQLGNVQITARLESETVIALDVVDDGCGMDEQALKLAFEPFFTTKRNAGGTGLGLHIVHNLVVNVLGGTIELSSQAAQGSCFAMRFPRKARLSAPLARQVPLQKSIARVS